MGGATSRLGLRGDFLGARVMLRLVARQAPRSRRGARDQGRSSPRERAVVHSTRAPHEPQRDRAGLLQLSPIDHDRRAAALRREKRRHHDRGAGAILDQRLPFFDQRHQPAVDARATQPKPSQATPPAASRGRTGSASRAQPLLRRETLGLAAKQRKSAAGPPHRRASPFAPTARSKPEKDEAPIKPIASKGMAVSPQQETAPKNSRE